MKFFFLSRIFCNMSYKRYSTTANISITQDIPCGDLHSRIYISSCIYVCVLNFGYLFFVNPLALLSYVCMCVYAWYNYFSRGTTNVQIAVSLQFDNASKQL